MKNIFIILILSVISCLQVNAQTIKASIESGFNSVTAESTVNAPEYRYINGTGMTYLISVDVSTAQEDNVPGLYFGMSGGFSNVSIANNGKDRQRARNWVGSGRAGIGFKSNKVFGAGYIYASGYRSLDRLPTIIELGLGGTLHYEGFNSKFNPFARFQIGVMNNNQTFSNDNLINNPVALQLTVGLTYNL